MSSERACGTIMEVYWYDKDVGYVRIHTESNTKLQVWVCAETPCGSKPHPNIYDAYTPIQ